MKKRILALTLSVMFIMSLSSCGDSNSSGNDTVNTEQTTTTTAPETTTTTTAPALNAADFFALNTLYLELLPNNSAGGLQYVMGMKYTGSKEIKYYTLHFSMYNSVDDPAYSDIGNDSTFSVRTSGPIKPGECVVDISKESPRVYCNVIEKLSLDSIDLEYFDGTVDSIAINEKVVQNNSSRDLDSAWTSAINKLERKCPEIFK